ncbi:protein GVQW3-like [Oratosquilla oratoria]|uniref:protein GVQW3-like n=1 Tax=Oratosquilla oratoria TaxID=337810 RepID=UPI003F772594
MMEKLEQRYCIKFCVNLGDSQEDMTRKIKQDFGDEAMGITQIKEWYRRFKGECTFVECEARSGMPSTSRTETVINQLRTPVMQNRGITIRELANEVGLSRASVHSIMKVDLGLKRSLAKFVPKQQELHDELTKYI